jgi:hypothetical protein
VINHCDRRITGLSDNDTHLCSYTFCVIPVANDTLNTKEIVKRCYTKDISIYD